jgi:uncharacterized protein (DUF736 family)
MAYEQNNNTGSLFKNERRQNDRQPEYRGTAIINGKEMRISAWVRTSKNGTKFFSLAFDEPYQTQSAPTPTPQPQKQTSSFNASDDKDLPF